MSKLGLSLNEERFVSLLGKLIGEVKHLQNNPSQGLIPEEDRVGHHVLELLEPHSVEKGGPLKIQRVTYKERRNNIIIEYPGTTDRVVSFVGSHMDVVPANPEDWQKDPFKLTIEGDRLYGRGTTDCLGHVALLTDLFLALAEKKPTLNVSVVAVFIANEENSEIEGIGVDELMKQGLLEKLKNGPLYWVDSADKQPCIGTGGVVQWKIHANGKNGHSGLPQNAINSLILAYEGSVEVMRRFHEDYPAHEKEREYNYNCPSTMKLTQWAHPPGGINQIPGKATVTGDIRLTPFYNIKGAMNAVEKYVKEIDVNSLPGRGPVFKHELADGSKGALELEWVCEPCLGVACDIKSDGYLALAEATKEVLGEVKPEALTGSLPCIGELKEAGFDVQICGYGVEAVYHGLDEYCNLSDMKQGYDIFVKVIDTLNAKAANN